MIVERRILKHQEVEVLKRLYYGLIPVPWLLALVLFGNGAFDSSKPQIEPARVIGKFAMMGPVPSRRLIVSSWREDRSFGARARGSRRLRPLHLRRRGERTSSRRLNRHPLGFRRQPPVSPQIRAGFSRFRNCPAPARPTNLPLSMITFPRDRTVLVTPFTRVPSNIE